MWKLFSGGVVVEATEDDANPESTFSRNITFCVVNVTHDVTLAPCQGCKAMTPKRPQHQARRRRTTIGRVFCDCHSKFGNGPGERPTRERSTSYFVPERHHSIKHITSLLIYTTTSSFSLFSSSLVLRGSGLPTLYAFHDQHDFTTRYTRLEHTPSPIIEVLSCIFILSVSSASARIHANSQQRTYTTLFRFRRPPLILFMLASAVSWYS